MGFVDKIILASLFATLFMTSGSQLLPEDEVQALQTISTKLQNTYWPYLNRSSCNGGFNQTIWAGEAFSGVGCNCTFNSSTVCHVIRIQMKRLNLSGTLPEEFVNLTHLLEIDFTLNYLNGSIPTAFGQLRIVKLSLIGNRISGRIPAEIGEISTLEELLLDDNLLEGNLPENLGSLSSLKRLMLSANNFSGTIPETYGNLRNLTDFRIDGSKLTGKIPEFIGNWTKIQNLDMQGTSMEGPIPAAVSQFRNLTHLRISDVKGPPMSFPDLQNMTVMKYLVLRNCSLTGRIPPYLGDMAILDTLDLSFNTFNAEIPGRLQEISSLRFMFLSHNMLTGAIPGWILSSKQNFDVSYNNFTQSSVRSCAQFSNVNLVASHSLSSSQPNFWCLQPDLPCPSNATHDSVFINCGGARVSFEGNEYDENAIELGPSHFESNDRWAFSSTGIYIENDKGNFVATNDTPMSRAGAPFYETARVSPSSLKYYGLCMRGGSYKVRLHFAEIMFSDTSDFSSLGRRIFDVAIQGKVVLTDYNIAEKAKGVRRGIVEEFDVNVNGSTLDIHLYWTGKGTTAIPDRGVYGPLISAIAVTSNYTPRNGISTGVIVDIVVAVLLAVVVVLGFLRWMGCLGGKHSMHYDLKSLDLQTGSFTLRQIRTATNNFDPANKIGEGGFGPVYKGVLLDGTNIAVKQLSSKSKQGNREFVNEIGMISALQHPHLVKLYGCCIEGYQLLLVYEYLENNSLARALFGTEQYQLHLDWPTRHKICIGIARGLTYLHEESRLKIVHRDIKATNVLLDKNLVPKISDFGLAKLDEDDNTHISTRIAGTFGYMAPEYAMRGYLTDKADVYSFGVVLLEIVSGRSNNSIRPKAESFYLLDWANSLSAKGNLLELVDPRLELNLHKQEIMRAINVALICTNVTAAERPSMSAVVSILEGKHGVPKLVSDSIVSMDKTKVDEIEMGEGDGDGDGEGQDNSMDAAWSGSSTSAVDLYPINPDTKYWEKRSLSGNSY